MLGIDYRKLDYDDIEKFIEMRINQLQEQGVEHIYDLKPDLRNYYKKHLADGTFVAWVAVRGDEIIATSGISFVEKPPYYSNTSGKIGLLSSMYTLSKYRRNGIAKELLGKLKQEAKNHGCGTIQITASEIGALLYSDFGFEKNRNFMEYRIF